ncbi:MAG TPA: LamG-like jellyroll fold domain-containing protein, partial [Bryobacteraceae bacterium]|nr:LamG-like jellyroll fold domain-containing protein [Bryobacteraceae bacterium]
NALVTSDGINDNHWHHVAAVNDGSTIWLYLDGQYTGSSLSSGEGLDSLGWYLGAQQSLTSGVASYFHQGVIDEFRFSNSVRSAGWIGTEFNNQSSPATFFSVGSLQSAP